VAFFLVLAFDLPGCDGGLSNIITPAGTMIRHTFLPQWLFCAFLIQLKLHSLHRNKDIYDCREWWGTQVINKKHSLQNSIHLAAGTGTPGKKRAAKLAENHIAGELIPIDV
jgi:hypothetical protein